MIKLLMLAIGLLTLSGICHAAAESSFLGPDLLWRPRESLLFLLQDPKGNGFTLRMKARDMNTYLQGPRPLFAMLLGPKGEVLAREFLEDDGVVAGNPTYCDGIYDPWQDFRYRGWHRHHSPNGIPAGKKRSPYLEHPEQLAARELIIKAPAAGPGLYRLHIIASWDHWISVTPDRPLIAGVHPGPGPLYVHGDRLNECWFWAPQGTKDIGVSLTEEVQPFNWRAQLCDASGKELGATTPRTFRSYLIHPNATGDAVYRLSITGKTPGCCLSLGGVPFVICPDAETAKLLHGGVEMDAQGRIIVLPVIRPLFDWAIGLKPSDVGVDASPPDKPFVLLDARRKITTADIPALLASQNLDPKSPEFGLFPKLTDPEVEAKFDFWNQKEDALGQAVAADRPGNTYFKHAGLIRRILLARIMGNLRAQTAFLWYESGEEPCSFTVKEDSFWGAPFRSNWYGLGHDVKHVSSALTLKPFLDGNVPPEVVQAWRASLNLWAYGRTLVHGGECSNQWCENLSYVARIYEFTEEPFLKHILDRGIGRIAAAGLMGRANPDLTPDAKTFSVGYGARSDIGRLGLGSLGDGHGFDAEYCNEQVLFIRDAWKVTQDPRILDWWKDYFRLKAHLAVPRFGHLGDPLLCPTDMSHRTPIHSPAPPLLPGSESLPYADTFAFKTGAVSPQHTMPCLEEQPFVRSLDHVLHCINTPAYYAASYTGSSTPPWANFGLGHSADGSSDVVGYSGPGYGGRQRLASKLAGLSLLYVKGCGPILVSSCQDVTFTNGIWGRLKASIPFPVDEKCIDPRVICSGFVTPEAHFDEAKRILTTTARFQYAPLKWTRTIAFGDDRLMVTIELHSSEDVDLTELYECIPYAVDRREVRVFDESLTAPKALHPLGPRGDGKDLDLEPVAFRAVDIASADGAGTTFVFEREGRCLQENLFGRSRTRSFSIPLATTFRAGEKKMFHYTILVHDKPVTSEQLKAAAP